MIKKVFHIILMLCIPAGLLLLLGLTEGQNKQHTGNGLQVIVDSNCGNHFLEPETIRKLVISRVDNFDVQPVPPGTLSQIKLLVEGNPYVRKAAIYRTIDGDIRIEVQQRDPLVRVINSNGQGFYIDREGITMPLSDAYTARVMVAGGYLQTAYQQATDLKAARPPELVTSSEKRLRDLYTLARFIDHDPFWRSLIDQIRITQKGHFELIPMNGAHVVDLGDMEQIEEKFDKLSLFYRSGLSQVGWNYYSRISLQFDKQVVCTK
jgi:cell division protein FtsQ